MRHGDATNNNIQINRGPNRHNFQRIYGRVGETGSFQPQSHVERLKTINVEQGDEIIMHVIQNLRIPTRHMTNATHIKKSSVLNILHAVKLYPHHFNPVQHLLPTNLPTRVQFWQFLRSNVYH